MTCIELIRYQIGFSAWANARVLSAAAKLAPHELAHDFKTSEGSILATLVHVYRAERIWLSRIQGPLVEWRVAGDDVFPALEKNWPVVGVHWCAWAEAAGDQDAQSELTYQDLRGNTHIQAVWKIVLHVVNHSTHHRGQAIGFMRTLGHTPPATDSILFARGQ